MDSQPNQGQWAVGAATPSEAVQSADDKLESLTSLFHDLNSGASPEPAPVQKPSEETYEDRLIRTRLGVAASLFFALRARHAPAAAHSVRVALVSSAWCSLLGLDSDQRDDVEVAGLLHELGVIGVPDERLALSDGEWTGIPRDALGHGQIARQILSGCCSAPGLLDLVYFAGAPYDNRGGHFDRSGTELPLGARLLAIVDCYDALTDTKAGDQAMARERALAELSRRAGSQLDPELVPLFVEFLQKNASELSRQVAQRWLAHPAPGASQAFWRTSLPQPYEAGLSAIDLFHEQLLETMPSGAVFVDTRLTILKWSRAVRDLTGIDAQRAVRRHWNPGLLGLRDENFKLITRERCPVIAAVTEGTTTNGRFMITDAAQDKTAVDICVTPVLGPDGDVRGVTLVLHDASSRVNLEERLQTLNEKASQDGLTGVANRAEFDRTHGGWFQLHLERNLPYSLIICDLDHFKKINDSYGHQAGDEALIAFGSLLRKYCRATDLVARYGGEEFVILCADCDGDSAAVRADNIREALAAQRLPMLNGHSITASFGVTTLQTGDTAEAMLRRADRALLQAKTEGRNTVVQLGSGRAGTADAAGGPWRWFWRWKERPARHVLQRRVLTPVPVQLATEKIRGFVAARGAQVLAVGDDYLQLLIDGKHVPLMRRTGDRPTPMRIELQLEELHQSSERRPGCKDLRTVVRVTIRPRRQRDRRRPDVDARARELLAELKSYLMASY